MRKLVTLLLFLVCILNSFSQSAENRYNSRLTQDGTLFFLMPQKIKDLKGLIRFEYDVTMLSWSDSATINFTFESQSLDFPVDFSILADNNDYKCDNYSILFTDIKKGHYEIRITSKFSNQQISEIIKSSIPPIFLFKQDGENKSATYKEKAWLKERKKLMDIYQLYKLSK